MPRNRWAFILFLAALLVPLAVGRVSGQAFGKNKVQYRTFDWKVASSKNFDVYFYSGEDTLAAIVLDLAEKAAVKLVEDLGHRPRKKIPIILYESHYDFEQTNITLELLEEGVGGFTEIFKNRAVIPFTGSYEELRHLVMHELTHAFMFDMMYGGVFDSILSAQYVFQIPLWFMEGVAEYESLEWDEEADMVLRDGAIAGYVVPLHYLSGGYLVYKLGQSAVRYMVDRHGREKLKEIFAYLKQNKNLDRAFERALGMDVKKFSEGWLEHVRKEYWPEIALHERGERFGKRITDHKKDGSYLNSSPTVSPKGDKVAYLSDRNGYMDLYLASAIDGKILRRLVRGEKSMQFEVIPSRRNALSWSPDEKRIAVVAKSGRGDVLYLIDSRRGRVVKEFRPPFSGISHPDWSPDGSRIVFTGLKHGKADLYVLTIATGSFERLTDDLYDDIEARWSPDGRRIAFASDRRWPLVLGSRWEKDGIGNYSLYVIDPETREITELVHTGGSDRCPAWSPDGSKVLFASSPTGISNLFALDTGDSSIVQLTDVLGGVFCPTWGGSDRIAFGLFAERGYDIYVAKEPLSMKAVMDELKAEGRVSVLRSQRDVPADSVLHTAAAAEAEASPDSTMLGEPPVAQALVEAGSAAGEATVRDSVDVTGLVAKELALDSLEAFPSGSVAVSQA
ncbi:MAG: hypothetical protein V2A71_11360, partial [Candidatus Eisenbacteria bacterium]